MENEETSAAFEAMISFIAVGFIFGVSYVASWWATMFLNLPTLGAPGGWKNALERQGEELDNIKGQQDILEGIIQGIIEEQEADGKGPQEKENSKMPPKNGAYNPKRVRYQVASNKNVANEYRGKNGHGHVIAHYQRGKRSSNRRG